MRKLLLLFLIIGLSNFLYAQVSHNDSLIQQAKIDSRKFSISKSDLKKFKKQRWLSTADYFKPSVKNTSNVYLLTDSVYVKSYRMAAFRRTRTVIDSNKAILIAGSTFAVIFGVLYIEVSNGWASLM